MTTHVEQDQIRAVLTDRAEAMRSRDARRYVSHYGPDVVKFDLAPPLQSSGPELLDPDRLQEWFADKGDDPIGYEVRDVHITAGDDVAFCHSLNRMGGDGQPGLWFRSTVGLRRLDGEWKVIHEHNSTPFYMDGSNSAALDLQP